MPACFVGNGASTGFSSYDYDYGVGEMDRRRRKHGAQRIRPAHACTRTMFIHIQVRGAQQYSANASITECNQENSCALPCGCLQDLKSKRQRPLEGDYADNSTTGTAAGATVEDELDDDEEAIDS